MQQRNRFWRGAIWAGLVICLLMSNTGCTRWFYRKQVDTQVEEILHEKDLFPEWKIERMTKGVYPDSRARFADPTNPDRPPMPPEDPAAKFLGPNPQKPRHAGTERVEGTGYLDLLAMWDASNRAQWATEGRAENPLSMAQAIQTVAFRQKEGEKGEFLPPPDSLPAVKTNPYLLRVEQAMELGLINSREFQTRREDLYLTALPVTRERFAFSSQYFALGQVIRERTGANTVFGEGDRWTYGSQAGFSKLFSTGALLLVGFANQTVLNLGNPANTQRTASTSTIDLDIVQPLLRGGGRAATLEPLTQTERNLLYDIRDYARFRKQYFQYMIGGGTLPGVGVGTPGSLSAVHPLFGALNGGNPARSQIAPAGNGSLFLGVNPQAPAEGYLPSLLKAAVLQNEIANVKALRDLLKLFDAYEGGGIVSALQVGQVQLQLLQSQSVVLAREQDLRDSLDNFKQQLGIPVNLQIELDTEPLRPIAKQFDRYNAILKDYEETIRVLDKLDQADKADKVRDGMSNILKESPLTSPTAKFKVVVPAEWDRLIKLGANKAIQDRLEKSREERDQLYKRQTALEMEKLELPVKDEAKLRALETEIALGDFELMLRRYEKAPWMKQPSPVAKANEHSALWRDLRSAFVLILSRAGNERFALLRESWKQAPSIIVDGKDLINTDVESAYEVVAKTALDNRLDLMNTRAQVVDAWRQVRVFANSLLGTFTVAYHMDSSTPPDAARPLAFQSSRTRHQVGLNLELPLVRLTERNAYRASQIALQRARRNLDQKEDEIVNQVRSEIRQLQVLAKNLKIQQQAVELAYQQVESSLETFRAPQAPGQGGDAGTAAALTQQLLNAYRGLPSAQNNLLTTWINYHVIRQQLFLDMELMPLDARGVWLDEFINDDAARNEPRELERTADQVAASRNLRDAAQSAP